KDIEQIDNIVGITTDIDQYEIIKEVQLNESNMRDTNMTQTELKEHILSLTTPKPISAIRTHDETIPIYLDSNHDNWWEETIVTKNGEEKLYKFITIKEIGTPQKSKRKNGEKLLTLMADIEGDDTASTHKKIDKIIHNYQDNPAYTVKIAGDIEREKQLMMDMLLAMMLAILIDC